MPLVSKSHIRMLYIINNTRTLATHTNTRIQSLSYVIHLFIIIIVKFCTFVCFVVVVVANLNFLQWCLSHLARYINKDGRKLFSLARSCQSWRTHDYDHVKNKNKRNKTKEKKTQTKTKHYLLTIRQILTTEELSKLMLLVLLVN